MFISVFRVCEFIAPFGDCFARALLGLREKASTLGIAILSPLADRGAFVRVRLAGSDGVEPALVLDDGHHFEVLFDLLALGPKVRVVVVQVLQLFLRLERAEEAGRFLNSDRPEVAQDPLAVRAIETQLDQRMDALVRVSLFRGKLAVPFVCLDADRPGDGAGVLALGPFVQDLGLELEGADVAGAWQQRQVTEALEPLDDVLTVFANRLETEPGVGANRRGGLDVFVCLGELGARVTEHNGVEHRQRGVDFFASAAGQRRCFVAVEMDRQKRCAVYAAAE